MDGPFDLLSGWVEGTKSFSGLEARPAAVVLLLNWERVDSNHVLIFDLSYVRVL